MNLWFSHRHLEPLDKRGNGCCLADWLGVSTQVPQLAHHWPIRGQRLSIALSQVGQSSSKRFVVLTTYLPNHSCVVEDCVALNVVTGDLGLNLLSITFVTSCGCCLTLHGAGTNRSSDVISECDGGFVFFKIVSQTDRSICLHLIRHY